MPHITVEYSANLDAVIDISALLQAVHGAALATGMVEIGGLRTRAERREQYVIADGKPANAFVAIRCRVGVGRDEATRARFGRDVFAAATACLDPVFQTTPLAISLEVAEIDPVGSLKQNNLRARL